MKLPHDFHFSQYNLQDYVDCPRRFELRHLRKLEWPAVQTAPVLEQELRMERGTDFHLLVQQWVNGIPAEILSQRIADPDLLQWWETFLREKPLDTFQGKTNAEFTLTAPFGGYRMVAKLDIVIADVGKTATIFDWKTSDHRPSANWLQSRVQTRLYPLMVVLAGTSLNAGQAWSAEQVSMHYWFVQHPAQPEVIAYTQTRFERDHAYLEGLITSIEKDAENEQFSLTEDDRKCKFCQYRSFCERGIEAGNLNDLEDIDEANLIDDSLLSLDLEQIGEIAF